MNKVCSHCKKENDPTIKGSDRYDTDWSQYIESRLTEIMREKSCCFNCAVWFRRIEEEPRIAAEGNVSVIINHEAYIAHPFKEVLDKGFNGFGGIPFCFQTSDGRVLKSNNVWNQGRVPEIFWESLPDNAKFINKKEFDQLTYKK